jgi:hypothetical protein
MATAQLELIFAQIKPLPMNDKLRLLQWVAEDLQPAPAPTARLGLIYGEFANAPERMSTEEDFKLAEWHPTEEQLNGG